MKNLAKITHHLQITSRRHSTRLINSNNATQIYLIKGLQDQERQSIIVPLELFCRRTAKTRYSTLQKLTLGYLTQHFTKTTTSRRIPREITGSHEEPPLIHH